MRRGEVSRPIHMRMSARMLLSRTMLALSCAAVLPAQSAPLRLSDVLSRVTASPSVDAARQSGLAVAARVASAARLPDPQLQFGLMNYGLSTFGCVGA